jgi:hypothetical protein
MKYSKYFGAKRRGFIKSKSVLAPKGAIHLLYENIRYDILFTSVSIKEQNVLAFNQSAWCHLVLWLQMIPPH